MSKDYPRLTKGAVMRNDIGDTEVMVHIQHADGHQEQLGSLFFEKGQTIAEPVADIMERVRKEHPAPATKPIGPEEAAFDQHVAEQRGRKFDTEKPRWDLLFEGMPSALEEVVKVLTVGAAKYADHNWRYVERPQQRYLAASLRHENLLQRGETHDRETNLHHLAHKLCCDLFRLELHLRGD